MKYFLYQIRDWVCNVFRCKNHCSVYYKNEKIFACKNCETAENHIKRMFNTVLPKTTKTYGEHIPQNVETDDWKKFRNSFKVRND